MDDVRCPYFLAFEMQLSMRHTIPLILLLAFGLHSWAQNGGSSTYGFLLLTPSPRVAAMGAEFASFNDGDPSLGIKNPALINGDVHNKLALNFLDYFADIRGGYAAYGFDHKKLGSFVGSVEFLDYGRFIRTDNTGQILGNFYANELAFNIGWGRSLSPNYGIGANLKVIQSNLDAYHSTGIGVDLAGLWHSDDNLTTATLLLSNVGRQITAYNAGEREPLPFRARIGVSRKPEHLPFRFNLVIDDLQKWNLRYDDPTNPVITIDPVTGEPIEQGKISKIADNALRHVVIGGEFSPSKLFALRFGYNYRHRQEMKLASRSGMVGFSFGMGLKISYFQFDFAHVNHSLAGGYNMFSIATDLDAFLKKKN